MGVASKDTGKEDWPQVASRRIIFQISKETLPQSQPGQAVCFLCNVLTKNMLHEPKIYLGQAESTQESGQYTCHLLTVINLDLESEVSCTCHMNRRQGLERA